MKRNWHQKYRSRVLSIFLVIGIVGGVFIIQTFFPSVFVGIHTSLNAASLSTQQAIRYTVSPLFVGGNIVKENDELKRSIALLEAKLLIKESESPSSTQEGIRGDVVAWPPTTPYDTLIISFKDAIVEESMLAFAYDTLPIGVISRIYDTHAEVRLFTSPGEKTDVWVGEKRITAVLEGHGGGFATITLPNDSVVDVEDAVLYPYRGGTPVGIISTKKVDESSGVTTYGIRFPLHPYSLSWVSIYPPL